MPPLSRQNTRTSILSWWSDRNPGLQGPTINLHAAAKPLSRFLYHRQAIEIIRKNQGSPLSSATLEIYSAYFPWDYVSWSTKAAILLELAKRAEFSEADARAVVDSPVFPYVTQMLESPDARARSCSCMLIRSLASHECTVPAIFGLYIPSGQLMSLLCDKDSRVISQARHILSQIMRWPDYAQAFVDVEALDNVMNLFKPLQIYFTVTQTVTRDIVVHSQSYEEHFDHLDRVLGAIEHTWSEEEEEKDNMRGSVCLGEIKEEDV